MFKELRRECEPGSFWTQIGMYLEHKKKFRINILYVHRDVVQSCRNLQMIRKNLFHQSCVRRREYVLPKLRQISTRSHSVTFHPKGTFFYEWFTLWECQRWLSKVFMTDQGKKKKRNRPIFSTRFKQQCDVIVPYQAVVLTEEYVKNKHSSETQVIIYRGSGGQPLASRRGHRCQIASCHM